MVPFFWSWKDVLITGSLSLLPVDLPWVASETDQEDRGAMAKAARVMKKGSKCGSREGAWVAQRAGSPQRGWFLLDGEEGLGQRGGIGKGRGRKGLR